MVRVWQYFFMLYIVWWTAYFQFGPDPVKTFIWEVWQSMPGWER